MESYSEMEEMGHPHLMVGQVSKSGVPLGNAKPAGITPRIGKSFTVKGVPCVKTLRSGQKT